MNTTKKFVFSTKLKKTDWENTTLLKDAVKEMPKLKKETKEDLLIFGSANLCTSLINAGLVDEFRLMVNPIVLGKGRPMFDNIKKKINLKLIGNRVFKNGNILLNYTVQQ